MNRLVSGALVASLLTISGQAEPRPVVLPPQPFEVSAPLTASDRDTIISTFDRVKSYWSSRHIGTAGVKLALLEGNATEICRDGDEESTVTAINPDGVGYCFASNTVIVSQAGVNALKFASEQGDMRSEDVLAIAVAHEMGHAMQDDEGKTMYGKSIEARTRMELQADRCAGVAISDVAPQAAVAARGLFEQLSFVVGDHGNEIQRLDSFSQGILTGDC